MIVVDIKAKQLELHAPFHPLLSARSKAIGGTWMGVEKGWAFPVREEAALRAICMDIWSVDGTPEAFESIVDIEICVDERTPVRTVFLAHRRPIYLVGREIAAALKSRKAARPGRGVQFLVGKPHCLETPSTWSTVVPNGCVFLVRDVPQGAIERFHEAVGTAGTIVLRDRTEIGSR